MKSIYDLLNEELLRMHWHMKDNMSGPGQNASNAQEFYQRILKMQNSILEMAKTHDPEIQRAIAELALTGASDGNDTKI